MLDISLFEYQQDTHQQDEASRKGLSGGNQLRSPELLLPLPKRSDDTGQLYCSARCCISDCSRCEIGIKAAGLAWHVQTNGCKTRAAPCCGWGGDGVTLRGTQLLVFGLQPLFLRAYIRVRPAHAHAEVRITCAETAKPCC